MNHVHQWHPGNDRTYVLLHGTGGDEASLLPIAKALDPDASVLGVRGNVMEGSAPRFFRRLSEGVFDIPDLILRTHELADFLQDAAQKYGFDPQRTVAIGYSNGANIVASLLLLNPEVLCGAILIRSMVPLEPEALPNLVGKHVLMLTGEFDPILPVDNAQRLAAMLREYGAEVTFELLRAGHELTRRDIELAQAWLSSHSNHPE